MTSVRRIPSLLLAAAALAIASCGELPDAGGASGTRLSGAGPTRNDVVGINLLRCSPLTADTTVATVGPAGGTLTIGPHTLVIPAGALDSSVTITAIAPSDSVNQVEFAPQGLQFETPASLTLSYANCNLLGISLPKKVVYTDDLLQILELEPSLDHAFSQTVTGRIGHFSSYAVAW